MRKRSNKRKKKIERWFFTKKEKRKDGELVNPPIHVQKLTGVKRFVLVRVKEISNVDYIEYENDGDTLSKTLPVTDYLDEIRQYLINKLKKLKSTGSS